MINVEGEPSLRFVNYVEGAPSFNVTITSFLLRISMEYVLCDTYRSNLFEVLLVSVILMKSLIIIIIGTIDINT